MNAIRRHSDRRAYLAAMAIPAMLIGSSLSVPSAQASYIVTLAQDGPNVVASGSGTIDLTGLSFLGNGVVSAIITPDIGLIRTGPEPGPGSAISAYGGFTWPLSFGSGGETVANIGSGDFVGIEANASSKDVEVPAGYTSGDPLSDTATYDNQTFSSLGATPGTYEWTWGTGAHADSFTLQIGAVAVPAPPIGRGLPVLLAVGGLLVGAKLLERSRDAGFNIVGNYLDATGLGMNAILQIRSAPAIPQRDSEQKDCYRIALSRRVYLLSRGHRRHI
jgi:hypothetical protein